MKTLFNLKSAVVSLICFVSLSFGVQAAVVSDGETQTIYAGQSIEVGTVTSEVVGTALVVTYEITADGWEFTETQMWIGTDLADMPQNKKGSPKIGNFPYHMSDATSATSLSVEFTIPLLELAFSCPRDDVIYHIAAHSSVQLLGDEGDVIQTETGWSAGDRFVERGMWGTYSSITLSCDEDGGPTPDGLKCETAYAYSKGTNAIDNDITHSFLDITEEGSSFNRWGWSNGAVGDGTYTWDLYAGAGQSDINKGTLVGTLLVEYYNGVATVSYNLSVPFTLDVTQVYVGNEILPRNNNVFTVAPGQYPSINDLDVLTTTDDEHIFTGLSGDIYVVAHADVCATESDWSTDSEE